MFTILGADGKEYGPVAADKIQAWLQGGRASLQTKARRDGETDWKTLGDFAEFATAAGAPPVFTAAVAPGSTAAVLGAAGEPELAGRGARLLAQIVDLLTGGLACLPGGVLLLLSGGLKGPKNPTLAIIGMGLIGLAVLTLVIVQIYLLSTRGQTIGKKLLDVRIVRFEDNSNPGFVKAFLLRAFVNGLIGAIPLFGGVYSLVDICFIFRDDKRCIHDLIAGTQVVKA